MNPTPRIVVGVDAVAATAATVGTRSDVAAMSTSMPRAAVPGSRATVMDVFVGRHVAAHRREQFEDRDVALRRGRRSRPATVTAPPQHGGDGQRVARRRGVGLDVERRRRCSARTATATWSSATSTAATPNAAITAAVSRTYGADTSGDVSSIAQAAVEQRADQHQGGDELAGHVAAHAHGPAAPKRTGDGDRQAARDAVRLDLGAERPQRIVQLAHRPGAQRRVAVDHYRPVGEGGEGGDEPRRRAGQTGVRDAPVRGRIRPPLPVTTTTPVAALLDVDAEVRRGSAASPTVSSPSGTLVSLLSPSASAAATRARLAMLFDPGTVTSPYDGAGERRAAASRAAATRPGAAPARRGRRGRPRQRRRRRARRRHRGCSRRGGRPRSWRC